MVKYHFRSRGRKYEGRISEKERTRTDLRGRQVGYIQGYDGCGRARGGERGMGMNVEAAREKLKSSRMEEKARERKEGGQRRGVRR